MRQLLPRLILILVISFTLISCVTGPEFTPLNLTVPEQYTSEPFPVQTVDVGGESDEAQSFTFTEDLPAQWWKLFNSPPLDQMIRQGLKDSPTLASAQAALRKAEENLRAVRGSIVYPAVDTDLQANRQRTSGNAKSGASDTYNLYNTSVAVSYTLDIFGKGRRQIEAYQAEVDYQRYSYEAAYLTLTANIVTTVIQEASLRAQRKATIDMIAMPTRATEHNPETV